MEDDGVFDSEFPTAKSWYGKKHQKYAKKVLDTGARLSMTNTTHIEKDTVAGAIVGAAVGGAIAGVPIAVLGGVLGAASTNLMSRKLSGDGKKGENIDGVVDELGAFYGILDVRIRQNARTRAAYAVAMFWLASFIGTVGVGLYRIIPLRSTPHDGKPIRLLEWVNTLIQRSGGRAYGTDILIDEIKIGLQTCSATTAGETDCVNRKISDPLAGPSTQINGMPKIDQTIKCHWGPIDGGSASVCRPPAQWYSFYGTTMMGTISNVSRDLLGVEIVVHKNDAQKPGASIDLEILTGNIIMSLAYFVLLSVVIYCAAYMTGRYYGGLVRGRCGNNKQCAERMMRLSSHLQDTGRTSLSNTWNPLAAGTMGWVVAQSLLGVSFL
jgi:hypothetical protein